VRPTAGTEKLPKVIPTADHYSLKLRQASAGAMGLGLYPQLIRWRFRGFVKVGQQISVVGEHLVSDGELFVDARMIEGLAAREHMTKEFRISPKRVASIDDLNVVLLCVGPQVEGERISVVRGGPLAPLSQRDDGACNPVRVVVGESNVVDGVGVAVSVDKAGEPRGYGPAAGARRADAWRRKLDGKRLLRSSLS
jgi:hypothetical protein